MDTVIVPMPSTGRARRQLNDFQRTRVYGSPSMAQDVARWLSRLLFERRELATVFLWPELGKHVRQGRV